MINPLVNPLRPPSLLIDQQGKVRISAADIDAIANAVVEKFAERIKIDLSDEDVEAIARRIKGETNG